MQGGDSGLSIYAKLKKAYHNHRLLSGLKKQLQAHNGPLIMHDTHFSRAIPKQPELLIYDCVDLPLMHQRTSKARRNRNKYLRALIDCNAKSAVSKAEIITITSPYYEPFLSNWMKQTIAPINLRNFSLTSNKDINPNSEIAAELKSHQDISHWMVIHNRIGEFLNIDGVLKAQGKLPKYWGLCFLGILDGKNSISEIEKRALNLCPDHKVIYFDPLYGGDKLSALKCFDLGLVPLIPESQNLKRCIPNRSLEFLCLGLPQLAARTRPLENLSVQFPQNIFVADNRKQVSYEEALMKLCQKIEQGMSKSTSSYIPDWAEDFEMFFSELDAKVSNKKLAREVIILSENNPAKNNRLSNIQSSLKAKGYLATVMEINLQRNEIIKHN